MQIGEPDFIRTIAMRLPDGKTTSAEVLCWDSIQDAKHGYYVRVRLTFDGRTLTADAEDAFEAFCTIRQQLEPEGIRPVCFGAAKNVYPSGMARDMAQGLTAFRLTLGRHAQMADLVFVFDSSDDVQPATLEEQAAFYEDWMASLPRTFS